MTTTNPTNSTRLVSYYKQFDLLKALNTKRKPKECMGDVVHMLEYLITVHKVLKEPESFWRTCEQIEDDTGYDRHMQNRSLDRLKELKLISWKLQGGYGDHRRIFRILWDNIVNLCEGCGCLFNKQPADRSTSNRLTVQQAPSRGKYLEVTKEEGAATPSVSSLDEKLLRSLSEEYVDYFIEKEFLLKPQEREKEVNFLEEKLKHFLPRYPHIKDPRGFLVWLVAVHDGSAMGESAKGGKDRDIIPLESFKLLPGWFFDRAQNSREYEDFMKTNDSDNETTFAPHSVSEEELQQMLEDARRRGDEDAVGNILECLGKEC